LQDEGARDLDELAVCDAQGCDFGFEMDSGADIVECGGGFSPHPAVVEQAETEALLPAKKHVFEHGHGRDQARLLIDRADPKLTCLLGRELSLSAVDQDLACVLLFGPGHDLHQRRLARAVLAYKSVDFCGPNVQGNVGERSNSAVVLVDASCRNERPLSLH